MARPVFYQHYPRQMLSKPRVVWLSVMEDQAPQVICHYIHKTSARMGVPSFTTSTSGFCRSWPQVIYMALGSSSNTQGRRQY